MRLDTTPPELEAQSWFGVKQVLFFRSFAIERRFEERRTFDEAHL